MLSTRHPEIGLMIVTSDCGQVNVRPAVDWNSLVFTTPTSVTILIPRLMVLISPTMGTKASTAK